MKFVRRIELLDGRTGRPAFLVVHGEAGRPAAELDDELARVTGAAGPPTFRGARLLRDGTAEDTGVHDGAVLSAGASRAAVPTRRDDGPVLRVVGGPDAGGSAALSGRPVVVGRGADADLRVRDPDISRLHAAFEHRAAGVVMRDNDSANGTFFEDREVAEAEVRPGEVVRVGQTLLEIATPEPADTVQLETEGGLHLLHRRFRPGEETFAPRLRFPTRRVVGEAPPLNLLLAIAPGAAFAAIALITQRYGLLIFAVLSPLLSVARLLAGRTNRRREQERADVEHAAAVRRLTGELAELRATERRRRRDAAVDPATVVETALRPTRQLWSRRPEDADVLALRVGSASQPSRIVVEGPEDEGPPRNQPQPWLPVAVPLPAVGGLALVGPLDRIRPLGRWCVLQAAVLHAPAELRIVVLSGDDGEQSWSWTRWLPHLRDGADDIFVLIGSDEVSRRARVEELRRMLSSRRQVGLRSAGGRPTTFLPRVLVVYDDVSARMADGVAEVLRDGPAVGIHALTLDEHQVPEGCHASVVLGEEDATVEQVQQASIEHVLVDGVSAGRCEEVARRLSSVRLIGEDSAGTLPGSARLLDLVGAGTPDSVADRWRTGSPSTSAVIGVSADGPAHLDLRRDGPHGLVAGTTRSGKSEFVKTLVASMALENHPDDLVFLFIDFKGGGDYQILKRLPHAIGLSTSRDDDAEFDRTLVLLQAELDRRQGLLSEAQATTIEGYQAARQRPGGPDLPLPRLLVVVDEFAELKSRRSDQLEKLVSVARTGAAFGIHLLLATQQPQGVVTSQIEANVGLRLCFRVEKEEESTGIIGTPEAGQIAKRHPGRCLLRSPSTPLMQVQTARVAGARPGSAAADPIRADVVTWQRLGYQPAEVVAGEVPDPETDLWDILEATTAAAARSGWESPAVPWPGPLPGRVAASALIAAGSEADGVPVGLVDDPARQARGVLGVRLGAGHVAVVGSPRTGRTTALRTFLAGLARACSTADAHIAVLDFAGGGLRAAAGLPHCIGAAIDDWELCERLLKELEDQVKQRREAFARDGWADLEAQRTSAERPLPWLVLVIDGWDGFAEEGARRNVTERVATLLSRGTSVGLQVLLGGSVVAGAVARHIGHRYVLRFNRVQDAENHGLRARQIPAKQEPGRAIEAATGRLVQFAELDDEGGVGQPAAFRAAVNELAAAAPAAAGRAGPQKVAALSAEVRLEDLLSAGAGPAGGARLPVLLGLGSERGQPVWVDLAESGGRFFVAGPPKSGRSTALLSLARSGLSAGLEVLAVTPRFSPLSQLEGSPGVRAVLDAAAGLDLSVGEGSRGLLIVIDDLELVDDGKVVGWEDAGETEERSLAEVVKRGVAGRAFVAAGRLDWLRDESRGLGGAVRSGRAGLVLSPSSVYDGSPFFGGRLPEAMIFDGPPGRAVAGVAGRTGLIQVGRP